MQSNHYCGIYFKAIVPLFFLVQVFWFCLFPSFLISLNRIQIQEECSACLKNVTETTVLALLMSTVDI